eukprot:sb/3470804/
MARSPKKNYATQRHPIGQLIELVEHRDIMMTQSPQVTHVCHKSEKDHNGHDSVVHDHLCHEGGARVVQVAREPVWRTEFVHCNCFKARGGSTDFNRHFGQFSGLPSCDCAWHTGPDPVQKIWRPFAQIQFCHIHLVRYALSLDGSPENGPKWGSKIGRPPPSPSGLNKRDKSVAEHNCIFLLAQLNFSQKMQWCPKKA